MILTNERNQLINQKLFNKLIRRKKSTPLDEINKQVQCVEFIDAASI